MRIDGELILARTRGYCTDIAVALDGCSWPRARGLQDAFRILRKFCFRYGIRPPRTR